MKKEEERVQRSEDAKSSRIALLTLVSVLSAVMLSERVLAQGLIGRAGSRVSAMLSSYAANPGPTFFDLIIFFTIFFALCWIGFNQVFKEAKNANIALSAAVSVALSVALVYGGRFTLKKMLPFAAVILFFLLILGIYAVLKKFLLTKDTTASRIVSFVVAILISVGLLFLAWNMICSDYNCERNPVLQKILGSQSVIGKLFGGVNDAFGGESYLDYSPEQYDEPSDDIPGEDTEGAAGEGKSGEGAGEYEGTGSADYALIAGVALVALLLLGGGIFGWTKMRRMWKKSPAWVFASRLKEIDTEENSIIRSFRELCEAVKNEQTTFDQSRHIVDRITTDIKETIGGEIDFVKGQRKEVDERIDQLRAFNLTERHLIIDPSNGILANMQRQLKAMDTIPAELKKEIDAFDNIAQHFDEHDKILQTFKQYSFSEKESISRLIEQLKENRENFLKLARQCNRMIEIYNSMHAEVDTLAGKRKLDNYHLIVRHVREIRDGAIRLNKIFAWKVSMMHYLGSRMKEVQAELDQMHETERATMAKYLTEAKKMEGENQIDIAIYLALHVLENAKYLHSAHLDQASRKAIDAMVEGSRREDGSIEREGAKDIIRRCIPLLFGSFEGRIKEQLMRRDYKRLEKLADTISRLQSVEADLDKEFSALINNTYSNKLADLKSLCRAYARSEKAAEEIGEGLKKLTGD